MSAHILTFTHEPKESVCDSFGMTEEELSEKVNKFLKEHERVHKEKLDHTVTGMVVDFVESGFFDGPTLLIFTSLFLIKMERQIEVSRGLAKFFGSLTSPDDENKETN